MTPFNFGRFSVRIPQFSSQSLSEHWLRGALGIAAFVAASIAASYSIFGWLVAAVAFVAWRGCITCWLLGLYQTIVKARTPACDNGTCRLIGGPPAPTQTARPV